MHLIRAFLMFQLLSAFTSAFTHSYTKDVANFRLVEDSLYLLSHSLLSFIVQPGENTSMKTLQYGLDYSGRRRG